MIHQIVVLGHLPRASHQESVIRAHATVDHPNVLGDLLYLVSGVVLEQNGLVLLLSSQNNAVNSLMR